MTLNAKHFDITFTADDCVKLHRFLHELYKQYKEKGKAHNSAYKRAQEIREYRDFFAELVSTNYMGEDA